MNDPSNRSRRPRPTTRPRRPRGGSGWVVTTGVAEAEREARRASPGSDPRVPASPVAVPENQIALILRHNDEEWVIGEGQLRNVDVSITPGDLDITAFGDLDRRFIARSSITHITINLEVDRGAR